LPAYGSIGTLFHTYALTAATMEFWAKPTSVTGTQAVLCFYNVSDNRGRFQAFLNGTTLNCQARDAGAGIVASYPGTVFAIGSIYHVVLTWTGTTQTCFINGVSQTPTYSQTTALSAGMTLGTAIGIGTSFAASTAPTLQFNGLVSDAALYPTVLSSTRAGAHYTAGIASGFIAAALNFNAGFNNDFGGGVDS
jgi:hypothetical protein